MKRNVTAGLAALMLTVAMAVPAAAAVSPTPTPKVETTNLSTSKEAAYILTIPGTTAVKYGAEETPLDVLKVTGNVDVGDSVIVSAVTNVFIRSGNETETLAFTLMDQRDKEAPVAFQSEKWSEKELRADTPKEIPLSVNITEEAWKNAKAGSYSGSIVFAAEYVTAS